MSGDFGRFKAQFFEFSNFGNSCFLNIMEQTKKLSREEWRKVKELEEARKAGTAPAAVDEEGKDINPHIPQYISSVPWYYNSNSATLKHQRPQEDKQKSFSSIDQWYQRGTNTQSVAKKFRKGACENCGAMGHQKKECFERPRKLGAKFTKRNMAADDYVQPHLDFSYDGKRDRWAGYDPAEHKHIIAEYERIEEAKIKLRTQKLNDGMYLLLNFKKIGKLAIIFLCFN